MGRKAILFMQTSDGNTALTARSLAFRDGLTFLVLSAVATVLFVVTLLLFRSFEGHREDLGREWAARGRAALKAGHADRAVGFLRTSLTYQPDDRANQLLLADALADSGRTEEAFNYFLNLWEPRPGDGFINLQLARLQRKRGNAAEAVNYYRAAIFGSWNGDGVQRRREVRLELADYLADRGDISAARNELLVAAGNAPDEPKFDIGFGDRFHALGDLPDALASYRKAIAKDPNNATAIARAGRIAYEQANYPEAHRLLQSALRQPHSGFDKNTEDALKTLEANSQRLQDLDLSRSLSPAERAAHVLAAAAIARKRLDACAVQPAGPPAAAAASLPLALTPLAARWTAAGKHLDRRGLQRDSDLTDAVAQLVFDTETQAAAFCKAPTGDDALLLKLARAQGQKEQ